LGNGISNPLLGIFDPQIAGIGIHQIVFISPTLCLDTTSIEVFAWQPAIIAGLDPAYCYKDTLIAIAALPPGGSFTGPGMSGNLFNPKQAGPGQHLIMYEFGTGNCKQTATAVTIVSPPVEVITSFDTDSICYGEFLTVSATASGGASAAYSYVWNQGLGPGRSHPVSPAGTITYTVTASDGCSDPAQASSTIVVNPQFTLSYSISDTVCFEEPGYAVAHVNGPGNYAIAWDVQPPQNGDTLFAPAFYDYDLTVTDLLSGCQISGNVVIPSHPYVRADFTPNPNNDCGSAESPEISFIDLSTGGTQGIWYFGDGTSAPYIAGNAPVHTYQDTGKYTVTLIFDNNSGCADTATAEVCIIPEKAGIYIPNAFSPNYDGINDLFLVKGTGVDVFSITIFDRWGNVVYTSEDIQAGWDGQVNGFGAPEGVYVYLIQGKMRSNNPRVNFGLRELLEKGTVTLIR
jgi:gliding motility-associated-like protein